MRPPPRPRVPPGRPGPGEGRPPRPPPNDPARRCRHPIRRTVAALFPTHRLDSRRDFRHLLQLVKASGLLHYQQRDRDEQGNVIATIADYAIAERLARSPLGAAATGISDGARLYLAALREKFHGDEFKTSEAQKVGPGLSRPTRYRRLVELNAVGAVEQTEAARGKVAAKWRLTDVIPEDGSGVLPQPEKVIARLSGETLRHGT